MISRRRSRHLGRLRDVDMNELEAESLPEGWIGVGELGDCLFRLLRPQVGRQVERRRKVGRGVPHEERHDQEAGERPAPDGEEITDFNSGGLEMSARFSTRAEKDTRAP